MTKNPLLFKILLFVIAVLPMLIMAYLIKNYAVNAPHWDDHAIRIFIDKYESNGFLEKIKSIFSYHNEHRIGLTRLVGLLIFKFEGFLNFRSMQIIGNLSVLTSALVFHLVSRRFHLSYFFTIIISCLLFNLAFFENSLWGMASIQNFGVIFFALATFYLLSFRLKEGNEKVVFTLALVFSGLALFTSGNGTMIPVLGFMILLMSKKYRLSLIWSGFFAIMLFLYFQGYSSIPSKNSAFNMSVVNCFFAGIGSFIYFEDISILSNFKLISIIGGLLFGSFLVLLVWEVYLVLFKKEKISNFSFLLALGIFILGTLLIVSINRSHIDASLILSSKYRIYSHLAILLFFIYVVKKISLSLSFTVSGALAMAICVWWGATFLENFKKFPSISAENNAFVLNNYNTGKDIKTSYKALPSQKVLNLDFKTAPVLGDLIDSIKMEAKTIDLWERVSYNSAVESYAIFKNDSSVNYVPMVPRVNKSFIGRVVNYFESEKKGSLNLLNFPSGIYELYYLRVGKENELFYTGKILRVRGVKYQEAPKNW